MLPQSVQKILIYLSVALLIVYLGYRLVNTEPTPDGLTMTSQGDAVGQEITGLINKLENISIDKSVFTSTVFQSLVDYSVVLSTEEQGKTNPFQNYPKPTSNSNSSQSKR